MLRTTLLGPASSPGQLYHSRSSSQSPLTRVIEARQSGEEELAWFDKTLIWSRAGQVYRKYTYDHKHEDISYACFGYFKSQDLSSSNIASTSTSKTPSSSSTTPETFGPFHTSQHAKWGSPSPPSSSSQKSKKKSSRSLIVFLKTRAHIYSAGGEDIIVQTPFVVERAWAMDHDGLLIQRKLEKREQSRDVLRGMDSNTTVLDELFVTEESWPRLYTLHGPFEEFKPIKGDLREQPGNTVIFVGKHPSNYVVLYNNGTSEIIVTRRKHISETTEPAPPEQANNRARPSINRNPSNFGSNADRKKSLGADPMDRTTRRAPRLSRGMEPSTTAAAGELQAALEPTVLPGPIKGKGRARMSVESETRRQSHTFLGQDEARVKQPGLQAIVEKDLRETTMMMGLEKDETVESDIILERIWSWRPPDPSEDINVFLTTENSIPILNIHVGGKLYSFATDSFALVRCMPCQTAIPVSIDGSDIMILDDRLRLVTGQSIHPVELPRLPEEVAHRLTSLRIPMDDVPMGSERHPIRLLDPAGSAFTIYLSDGENHRLSIDLGIKDPLVQQCLEAIGSAISPESFQSFRIQLISQLNGLSTADHTTSWTTFTKLLSGSLGLPLSPSGTTISPSADPVADRLARFVKSRRNNQSRQGVLPFSPIRNTTRPEEIPRILLALHLAAQDCRLSSSRQARLREMIPILVTLARKVGREDWADYWLRIALPSDSIPRIKDVSVDTSVLDQWDTPPDILSFLHRNLITATKPFPNYTNTSYQTPLLCHIYQLLNPSTSPNALARASAAVSFIVEKKLDQDWLADIPPGVAMPILEAIRQCQNAAEKSWSPEIYDFIGRNDLAVQCRGDMPEMSTSVEADEAVTIGDIIADRQPNAAIQPSLPNVRFGSDRRVAEVERMLQSTRVRTISVQEPKGATEQEIVQYHQSMVNTIAQRTLAVTFGQGIFEYGTRRTTITNTWQVPLIELACKIIPATTTLKAQISSDHVDWPCFHNGVASALSISPDSQGIDSSWIVFNRPANLSTEHGGFLLGLGLTGHLRKLHTYHAFPYLEPRHDFTSVGLLLGLGCSYAGSEDLLITKVLSLHTHALLPLGSMELNASPTIQSSSLVGLGLIHVATRNLRIAETALGEVGRKTLSGVDTFRDHAESYSFSAAMAFGLITLGRGGQSSSEVDRRLLARLNRCIHGDPAGSKESIDSTLTAPGATLALGLMYLKSHRSDIRDTLIIPSTALSLESVRPDFLLVRTYARSLIMWDEISPSLGWIEDQIPSFIQHAQKKRTMDLTTDLAYLYIAAGACWAVGVKYAGTASELAHNNLLHFYGIIAKAASGSNMTYEGKIRRTAARQCLSVVTIALCSVMAGTGELNVLRRLRISHGQEGHGVNYGTHMAMHAALGLLFLGRGHYTLGSSNLAIAALSIAFFPRFLPTPDDNKSYPQAFRHLWALAVEPRCLMARDVDTGEAIYLPIKVRMRESNQIRTQSLISPTLVAPFNTLLSIEVDSVRYWPMTYDLTNPKDFASLIKSCTIYVKRKAGFLDYNADPKGNRSIFVRAGSMTGFDMHYDLISRASPPGLSSSQILDLVKSHSQDPYHFALTTAFASTSTTTSSTTSTRLDEYIRLILLECISLDKPGLIGVYLDLYDNHQDPENQRQIRMIKNFYNLVDQLGILADKRPPLVRAGFIAALGRLPTDGVSQEVMKGYIREGKWSDGVDGWLLRDNIPALPLLQALGGKVKEGIDNGVEPHVLEVMVRESSKLYEVGIAAQWDVEKSTASTSTQSTRQTWKADSINAIVRIWSE